LKLFKRRGGKLWVSRTRPRLLDSSVVLSDRVAKIIEQVKAKPGILMKELIERLVPGAAETPAEAPAAETPAAETPAAETPTAETPTAPNATPAESTSNPLAEERIQVLKDLHWLNSEGYLIEYSDGAVFIGVIEPPPAKPKPPKPATAEQASLAGESEVADKTAPPVENAPPDSGTGDTPPVEAPPSSEHVPSETDSAQPSESEDIKTEAPL
jgi:hypothetical protein